MDSLGVWSIDGMNRTALVSLVGTDMAEKAGQVLLFALIGTGCLDYTHSRDNTVD
jgi:hypothetical protein